MIYIKTAEEIERVKAACVLTSRTLGEVAKWVKPGVTTRKLDNIAREFILDNGVNPLASAITAFPAHSA